MPDPGGGQLDRQVADPGDVEVDRRSAAWGDHRLGHRHGIGGHGHLGAGGRVGAVRHQVPSEVAGVRGGHDVRMVQGRDGLRFQLEAAANSSASS